MYINPEELNMVDSLSYKLKKLLKDVVCIAY